MGILQFAKSLTEMVKQKPTTVWFSSCIAAYHPTS
jgi:hypothetical protein